MPICQGRVAVVTGAGRGIGRAHALELARQGARVVVNDLGTTLDGKGTTAASAEEVVDEIRAAGGEAIANAEDIADWAGAGRLIQSAIDTWGRLDVLVNNAGFVRDRMFVSATEEEWDAVLRVHVRGHFCAARHAAAFWREAQKKGEKLDARIINTSSGAGLLGSVGQSAYSAAKGAILSLTLVQAAELGRYGVTVNAIAPAARTRMTETIFADMMKKPESGFDAMAPENIAPLVAYLASPESRGITGRVFEVSGGKIAVYDGWCEGPSIDKGARWEAHEIGSTLRDLLAQARPPTKPYGA
jgi:NAD(P)-dependent dehydrogenase (short-subunit alcohol dehydrogenase family)